MTPSERGVDLLAVGETLVDNIFLGPTTTRASGRTGTRRGRSYRDAPLRDGLQALLVACLEGKAWSDRVRFAHEVARLKPRVEGHVERMIPRQEIHARLQPAAERVS